MFTLPDAHRLLGKHEYERLYDKFQAYLVTRWVFRFFRGNDAFQCADSQEIKFRLRRFSLLSRPLPFRRGTEKETRERNDTLREGGDRITI